MTAITFDTLAYSARLQKAGISREHADALAAAQAEAINATVEARELVTKRDLELTKHELLKWMVTAMIAQTAVLVGIIAALK